MEKEQLTSGDFKYIFISNEDVEISRYTGNASKLEIPDMLDSFSVICIGDEAFRGCGSLTDVAIGEGIQYIGAQAFGNCSALTRISIPPNVISIEDSAFEGCSDLLTLMVKPYSRAHFWALENHKNFELSGGPFVYGIHTWWPECAVIEEYIGDGGDIIVPDKLDGYPVVCIWERAFRGVQSLTGITLPEGIKCISDEAFCSCASLKRIRIPATVNWIGKDAFDGCPDDLIFVVEEGSYAHRWAEEMKRTHLCQ